MQGNVGCMNVMAIVALGLIGSCIWKFSLTPFAEWMDSTPEEKLGSIIAWLITGLVLAGVLYLIGWGVRGAAEFLSWFRRR